ncbi:MAG TPA: DUF2924 domain-containing protein [bacterium]|nr:MAG: hypothetical protein BWY28_02302 [bacterium ADurb.Bin236]HPI77038.1 DUF2924 domain-containing protein [bacterium]
MSETIAKQIQALRRMSVADLRAKYHEVYGEHTRSANKDWLWKRIAWRLQELSYGGLSERARNRAAEIADEADLRLRVPRNAFDASVKGAAGVVGSLPRDKRVPAAGAAISRIYKGESHTVVVVENGFEYEGITYKSLTAVARKITGSHWNGYSFFNL